MIVDLRDYTTTPGNRDRLIERCEGLLFDEQVRLGATFLGAFRDAEADNHFVWLRAMRDLPTRKQVLTDFYTNGAMWKANRTEVNSWIADSDDVLLIRPLGKIGRPAHGPCVVGMYSRIVRKPLPAATAARLKRHVASAVEEAGGRLLATFATDPSANNYPRHPIRTGEYGLVWFATFAPDARATLGLEGVTERRLLPTARSAMR